MSEGDSSSIDREVTQDSPPKEPLSPKIELQLGAIEAFSWFALGIEHGWPESKNPDTKFFETINRSTFRIPATLQYENVKNYIDPAHQESIHLYWDKVVEAHRDFYTAWETLKHKWGEAPQINPALPKEMVEEWSLKFHESLIKALPALLSPSAGDNDKHPETIPKHKVPDALELWKFEEKGLRLEWYAAYKVYAQTLRLYYMRLLEPAPESTSTIPVLHISDDAPVQALLYEQTLDVTACYLMHQTGMLCRAHHVEQPNAQHRLRKTGGAFFLHEIESMQAVLRHLYPYLKAANTAELRKNISFLAKALIVAGAHDIVEDTALSPQDLRNEIKRLIQSPDSHVNQLIKSGFGGEKAQKIFEEMYTLTDKEIDEIIQSIEIISHNIEPEAFLKKYHPELNAKARDTYLTNAEKQIAESLGIGKTQISTIKTDKRTGKIWNLSLKAQLCNAQIKKLAIIGKLVDRTNNLETLAGSAPDKPQKQLDTLYATYLLIRSAFYAHVSQIAPKILLTCIEATLREYHRLIKNIPDLEIDQNNKQAQIALEKYQGKLSVTANQSESK